jgi:ferredoxin
MQIYYFSGTGNSLHVAKELNRRFPDATLVPIISALHSDKIETKAEVVGLVFPIHAFTMPFPVRQFLMRADLRSARYVFALTTRLCSDKVFSDMDNILAGRGKSLDACFPVEMPCNYIPLFDPPSQEEITRMESALQRRLDEVQEIIANRRKSRERDDAPTFILSRILLPVVRLYYQELRLPDMERSFYADPQCTGCGLCEKICLSGKIVMKDKRPEWTDRVRCTYCFACLNYCPVQAIQIKGRKTVNRGRYHHPEVNAKDIADEKRLCE